MNISLEMREFYPVIFNKSIEKSLNIKDCEYDKRNWREKSALYQIKKYII